VVEPRDCALRLDLRLRRLRRGRVRHAIRSIVPAHHLKSSYCEHWIFTFEDALIKRGFVSRDEFDARIAQLRNGCP